MILEGTLVLPSDNISCVGNLCTVNATGPVTVGLQFPSTTGKFYFRYRTFYEKGFATDLPLGVCIGSSVPMREYGQNSDFVLAVPEQTISFNFRATKIHHTFLPAR